MARKKHIENPDYPFHLSARCINREWFLRLDHTWAIMQDFLYLISRQFDIEIYSFVLMANHFHLIARFPGSNMAPAMQYFLRETSRQIAKDAGRINQVYSSRYFRSCLTSFHYLTHAYKYVYRNPVEAGCCRYVEEYEFSTLSGLLGMRQIVIPVVDDEILFENVECTLDWLNEKPDIESYQFVKTALSRPVFKLSKIRSTRESNPLEIVRY